MIGYLIYVYHKHLKVTKILVSKAWRPTIYPTSMIALDDEGTITNKYYTKVPGMEMRLGWGKIWCYDEENIEKCKAIIRNHYKETGRELYEEGNPDYYKRTKSDSSRKCPFCGSQYNLNHKKKYLKSFTKNHVRRTVMMCYKCNKWFADVIDYNLGTHYIDEDVPYEEYLNVIVSNKLI